MHTIKITPNLLFEYQCTSGKFIRLPNRIETFLPELECSTARQCCHCSISNCYGLLPYSGLRACLINSDELCRRTGRCAIYRRRRSRRRRVSNYERSLLDAGSSRETYRLLVRAVRKQTFIPISLFPRT